MNGKRLCKSSTDRAICGVCGGIAQYFEVDSIIIRLLMVIFSLAFGSGLLFYIIAAIIMPSEEQVMREQDDYARYAQSRAAQGGYYGNTAQYDNSARYDAQYGSTRSYEEKAASAQDAEFTAAPEDIPEAEGEAKPAEGDAPQTEGAEEAKAEAETKAAEEASPEGAQGAENAAKSEEKPYSSANTGSSQNGPYRTNYEAYQARQQAEARKGNTYGNQYQYTGSEPPRRTGNGAKLIGALLLIFGASYLLHYIIPRISTTLIWAVVAIIVGLVLLVRKK